MAKSNSFFGLRRGSTKTLTFSVLDGKQITKDRVYEVKNPRSVQQMQQRMYLKTTALGYAVMKSICDHSFEGVSYGMQSMQKFMRINSKLVANASTNKPIFGFAEYNDSTPNMGQFKISEGSLNAPIASAISLAFAANSLQIALPSEATTLKQVADALGVSLGDIVTICALVQNTAGQVQFVWVRFILGAADGALSADTIQVESNMSVAANFTAGVKASISFAAVDGIDANAAALYAPIRSQKSTNGYKRSTAVLNNVVGTPRYLQDYSTALLSYPIGDSYILNGGGSNEEAGSDVQSFSVACSNSTSYNIAGEGIYKEGQAVNLTAANVPGNKLIKWTGVPTAGGTTTTKTGNSCSFVMPAADVTIVVTAEDKPTYAVAVTNGTSASITGQGQYAEGQQVTLNATNIDSGKVGKWTGVPGGEGTTQVVNGNECSFVMPAQSVNITFEQVAVSSQKHNITNGVGTNLEITPMSAAEGEVVTLKCVLPTVGGNDNQLGYTDNQGQTIIVWNGWKTAQADQTETFTMPNYDITIEVVGDSFEE